MSSSAITLALVVLVPLLFMLFGLAHARRHLRGLEDYITARGSIGAAVGTATLVATAMGAWILFSPAETVTNFGIVALAGYALGSAAPIIALLWIGARLRRLMPEGHSLTEYVWHRFGGAMYGLTLGVIVFYMLVFLAAELTGISLAVNLVTGTPLVATAVIVGLATLAYTAYGGLSAVIFTDTIQFLVIVGLLAVSVVAGIVGVGGPGVLLDGVRESAPHLLALDHSSGWQDGIALVVAILAANLFHQGYWQRVYACRDDAALRRALLLSAVVVVPIVFLSGLFGLMAVGAGLAEPFGPNASTTLFAVIQSTLPWWLALGVLVMAVALVMSSMDSLLNGLISSFTSDLRRVQPQTSVAALLWRARVATVVVALGAILVATQGYSVLYLFLLADLVAAAVMVPLFLGLYVNRYSGSVAVSSSIGGLIAGALFFPTPSFAAWLPVPYGGSLMVSFLAAVAVSSVGAVLLRYVLERKAPSAAYDFSQLKERVQAIRG